MEVVVTTIAIRLAKFQSNRHHQQTNTWFLTGRVSFSRPTNSVKRTSYLTSLTALFKGSDVPTNMGRTLLAYGSNCGQMPFLPPPVTNMEPAWVESWLARCKSVALTTESRLLLQEIFWRQPFCFKADTIKKTKYFIIDVLVAWRQQWRVWFASVVWWYSVDQFQNQLQRYVSKLLHLM